MCVLCIGLNFFKQNNIEYKVYVWQLLLRELSFFFAWSKFFKQNNTKIIPDAWRAAHVMEQPRKGHALTHVFPLIWGFQIFFLFLS
jgi:hypothetical protein